MLDERRIERFQRGWIRVYPVMENPEESWNSIFFPGLEKSWKLTPGFGSLIKMSWKFKDILLWNGVVYVMRSNFGVFHVFLYCDWNLMRG